MLAFTICNLRARASNMTKAMTSRNMATVTAPKATLTEFNVGFEARTGKTIWEELWSPGHKNVCWWVPRKSRCSARSSFLVCFLGHNKHAGLRALTNCHWKFSPNPVFVDYAVSSRSKAPLHGSDLFVLCRQVCPLLHRFPLIWGLWYVRPNHVSITLCAGKWPFGLLWCARTVYAGCLKVMSKWYHIDINLIINEWFPT